MVLSSAEKHLWELVNVFLCIRTFSLYYITET